MADEQEGRPRPRLLRLTWSLVLAVLAVLAARVAFGHALDAHDRDVGAWALPDGWGWFTAGGVAFLALSVAFWRQHLARVDAIARAGRRD